MKHVSIFAGAGLGPARWFTILMVCLLLCGVGALSAAAAPAAPPAGAAQVNALCFAAIDGASEYQSEDGSAVQAAINAAPAGALIKVAGTCTSPVAAGGQLVSITKDLTLEGGYEPGNWTGGSHPETYSTLLSTGTAGGRVVSVLGDSPNAARTVTLRNLTIAGGAGSDGGGVYLDGDYVGASWPGLYTIEGCTVTDNHVSGNGGGVWLADAVAMIRNSTISQNTAVNGGGVWKGNNSDLTIQDSTIGWNQALTGGGVHLLGSTSSIIGSLITQNEATGRGGGLWGWIYVTTSTISDNTAGAEGGGHYGTGVITASIYKDNRATSGGAIYAESGGGPAAPEARSSTFTGNSNPGIWATSLHVKHCTFVDNDYYGDLGNADVIDSIFAGTSRCTGAALDLGYNLHENGKCTSNPKDTSVLVGAGGAQLGPLQSNGGPTLTYKPARSSPAVGAGDPAFAPASGETDQRLLPRVAGARTDMGSVEIQHDCIATIDGVTVYRGEGETLQEVVDAAAAGATIKLAGACKGAFTKSGQVQTVYIDKNLTIAGGYADGGWSTSPDPAAHPTVLDAQGAGRVVVVAAGATVKLYGLDIINGAQTNGAGIYNDGALTVETCTVRNNIATGDGGGLYNAGAATILYSLVQDNQAVNGAGAYHAGSAFTVRSSTFTGNQASAKGGGVYGAATAALTASTFYNNSASTGGAMVYRSAGTCTLAGSIFAGGAAGGYCTGITDGGYNLDDGTSCGFTAATSLKSTNPRLKPLGYDRGLMKVFALEPASPAINAGDPAYASETGETDQRGLPRLEGGRIDIGAAEFTRYCYATINGNTVYASEDSAALLSAYTAAGTGATIKAAGTCLGVQSGATAVLDIQKNLTLEGGYDPTNWSLAPDPAAHPTTLDANGGQRAVHIGNNATATLRTLTITGAAGSSDGDGGGVTVEAHAAATIDRCAVTNNRAIRGGGIYGARYSALTVRDSTISNNASSQHGGGVYSVTSLVMSGCTVSGNSSKEGGGVSVGDSTWKSSGSDLATISTTTFDGNAVSTGGCGGGLRTTAYTDVTVTTSTFSSNAANGIGSDGGAICGQGGTLTVSSSTFADNQATDQGGAIYAQGTNTVSSSTFHHNSATTGKMTYRASGNFTSYGNIFAGSDQAGYCAGGTTAGPFTSATYNLDDGDSCGFTASATNLVNTAPDLKSLGYYGGPTRTLPPNMGSPALDAGDPGYAAGEAETDQRGLPRVSIGKADTAAPRIDIGAVEVDTTCFAVYDDGAAISAVTAYEDASAVQAAISAAAAGNMIKVAGLCPAPYGSTVGVNVNKNVTVEGGYAPGAWAEGDSDPVGRPTVLDGGGRARVLQVTSGVTAALSRLNITGGSSGSGGGIYNDGTLTVIASNIYSNTASGTYAGAGIANYVTLTLLDSAVYWNHNTGTVGGGILNWYGTVNITNSTISENTSYWGGGLADWRGRSNIVASTFAGNRSGNWATGANIYMRAAVVTLAGSIIAEPLGGHSCRYDYDPTVTSGGYNRISDTATDGYGCVVTLQSTDQKGANIQLDDLALNGGLTMNRLPLSTVDNDILDIMPLDKCEELLGGSPADQRGRSRPRLGWMREPVHDKWCDAGSVERGQEIWTVCGPPLDTTDNDPNGRCRFTSIAEALAPAAEGDMVVVSGVVTEAVAVDKPVTIRGPRPEEITPGTHMGVVQAGQTAPAADCTVGPSIFTIAAGTAVTIEDLNIRHGCAAQGGAIRNGGTLDLKRITIYDSFGATGGGIYNDGALTVADSTVARNLSSAAGAGIYNASGKSATIKRSTLAGNNLSAGTGSNLDNQGASLLVGGSILTTTGTGAQCAGTVTSLGHNLVNGPACTFTAEHTGDPLLGELRDNGGATLTYAVPADSPAVDQGYGEVDADCAGQTDQRGLSRPFDVANGLGGHCDAGAYEYGPRILTVDAQAEPDPAGLLYADLQEALDDAMTGDAVEVRAGVYTGNFVAYRDVTIRHAEIDVSRLSPELGVDVRAILQASTRTISEQRRLDEFAGTTLTVQGFAITPTGMEPSGNITATLSGLTIRQGAGALGGGVHNRSNLTIDGCTIEGNAAVDTADADGWGGAIYNAGRLTLTRSTVSGNRAEHYGGAIYNDGTNGAASAVVSASTLAGNMASPLADQKVVAFRDSGLSATSLEIASGDEIRFENQTGQSHTMSVQNPPADVSCAPLSIDVPLIGGGLSEPLICTTAASVAPGVQRTVTVMDTAYGLTLVLTVTAPDYTPDGATLYQAGYSETTFDRSIVYSPGAIRTCARPADWVYARITSAGTNLFGPEIVNGAAGQSTCSPVRGDRIEDPRLAGLADNNTIDFAAKAVGGYGWTHALLPASPAIDAIAPDVCGAAAVHEIDLGTPQNAGLQEGDIVRWKSSAARTAVFNDGASDMRLVELPGGTATVEMQFNERGAFVYRVYDPVTQEQVGWATITVDPGERARDQREVALPQRGSALSTYRCDIGAYEFTTWVVGQPLPRPPSSTGKQAPTWTVTGGIADTSGTYDAWSPARRLDLAVRPTRPGERAIVSWYTDDATSGVRIVQSGIVVWPDAPQLHVSGAPVNLGHSAITDGYAVSPEVAQAYEGQEPRLDLVGKIVTKNVFTRTVLPVEPGDSYSVLQFAKGTQTSGDVKAQVVKTVGWNTVGIRDMRDRDAGDGYGDTDCVIGRELRYPAITDTAGTLGGHDDPEGRPGWLLSGTAYDGVPTAADLTWTQNTTDGLVEPAHVRELREGPILPILNLAPTAFANMDPVSGGHDLEVAWYRPDGRNVAWPVKSAGYRCRWPTDEVTQKIVIASELGSELGGQAILDTARYKDATIYHQSDASKVGYSPNHEHALLAASALGNAAPALYALRTDLFDRDTGRGGAQSYALLKYRDAAQGGRIQIMTYRVDLTQPASAITGVVTVPGAISPAGGVVPAAAAAPDAGALTLQIGSGVLSPHQTVTVPVDAYGATNLRSAEITITYDPTLLSPVRCTPNRTYVAERPHNVTVEADQGLLAQQVVHLRARAEAGTDLRWHWDFGDGTAQYDTRETSHVYAAPGTYRVTVTVSNGFFADEVTGVVAVEVVDTLTAPPVLLGVESSPYGCRIDAPGTLVLDLRTLNKHGLSGAFKLADLEFGPGASWPGASSADLVIAGTTLQGPDYSELKYGITAGGPVYAPTPLRGLLDIQPCEPTQAADDPATGTKPVSFWKDWKGMLWTRAAGDMSIQYFYPLQPGFYLDDAYASDHGLVDPDTLEVLTEAERAGMCVPWLDELPTASYPEDTRPLDWTDSTGEGRSDMVYPVGYRTSWPALPGLLNVGETVYERAKGGVSAIASQVAVARIYDDLAGGVWNNDSEAVEISGEGLDTYLTQLIDPLAQVSVELAVTVEDMPGLPTPIKSERLLYGGGLAIVGNTTDPDLNLPFALRSRVLYSESVADLDGDGVENGQLIFRGYYDGTSKEYIKGDPLLLLNVMSLSDRYRLQSLCDDDANSDCATWDAAIDALYWKTLNPRDLDLCRNADGETYAGDPGPAVQAAWDSDNTAMRSCTGSLGDPEFWRDGIPDRGDFTERPNGGYLIGVQDSDDNGVPEPYEGLGKGKALTAGNAAGTGYVTLVYNNDSSLGGLPVSLQVVKVQCAKNAANEESPYRGNLLVIKSDNLFDEKLTLLHTGDFGGRPDNFEFEWWIAAVDDTGVSPTALPPSYPWQKWTRVEPGLAAPFDVLGPQITIEGANVTTLRDNWVIMRYKNTRCPVCGNMYRYSAFAGDPSAKPTEVRAQLAEGWIKRVVSALNPFDARVDDFVGSATSTSVDMIRQAGKRYEGPIAMNADPENLNKVGLIEAYQTVLDRGRTLSIDAKVNDQGANAALLNVTSRIAQLYMLLGNDAYMDALDPIVGFDDPALSLRAPAIYAFANQFRPDQFGLIDEELALLRGRDETLGGVAAAPTYNRLTWNFTNGEGEVAYVTNYNLNDINLDGFIDEADAAILYPQGHGDAYGQQLTALSLYYQLLRHPDYTWIPRAEPVSVGGAPVVVDYYDERRFAAAAVSRAKMGAEIVNLTLRKHYAEPSVQPYWDAHQDPSDACDTTATPGCNKRAWGVADWAGRAGEGAYFDWLVANAILPPEDDRYADVRKIDRTTVDDVRGISDQLSAIQAQLDRADEGVNPLGLSVDAVLFDLDPALTKTTPLMEGQTHFEQVYDRTISTMANTLKMFEYANQAKAAQRAEADELHDFAADVVAEDRGMINELIELFGYPYDADIGVNGTYPDGYDGPDIFNYDLIERTELTDPATRCVGGTCPEGVTTYIVEYEPMDCLGFFITAVQEGTVAAETLCPNQSAGVAPPGVTQTISKTVEMGLGLDAGYGRYLPAAWPDGTTRKALGDIQMKLWGVYDTRIDYEQSLIAYENHTKSVEAMAAAIRDRYEVLARENKLKSDVRSVLDGLDAGIIVVKEVIRILNNVADGLDKNFKTAAKCVPEVLGFANSVGAPMVCGVEFGGSIPAFVLKTIATHSELANDLMSYGKDIAQRELDIELFGLESDLALRDMGREMQALLREEQSLELAAYLAADNYSGAMAEYDMAVQAGFRKLAELERMRKRWAGQVTSSRYNDMAYRLAGNDALAKYRQQFDLAQTYTFLTAAAYDYETNLRGDDPAAGERFLRGIVGARSLGELRWTTGPWDVEPIVGSGGLAEPLGKMRDNFVVLKGQMGFNNPQSQATRFSLRQELFRLLDSSDAGWRATLQRYYTPDIYAHPAVDKLAKKPYGMTGPQPGLVIPFDSAIRQGLNYFGLPLGPGDGAYNPTQFSTKVASVGVWFEGYDSTRLARMPYVYLLPAGDDVLRPRNLDGTLRYWRVAEQLLPLPYPLTQADFNNPKWIPGLNGLQGQLYRTKPYAAFQAFPYTEDMSADEMNTDTRLIGRSVWNTNWVLVIPGANLLADPQIGIDRFMQDVDDIYVYFQTYAYAGAGGAATADEGAATAGDNTEANGTATQGDAQAAAPAATGNPMPQPDAIFYGVALRDGTPLKSGTLTAILPRGDTASTAIAPITGTGYNYALSVPLSYYDNTDTDYASGSARLGENIRFTIDGVPALLKDAAGVSYQTYAITWPGTGYAVTVDVSGPGSYPPGDVNVSGKRDSADALLVLKYDVGLAQGVTTWPPGPGTVYTPLCDVTQDGACNSTDALRILMCDVGLASCPAGAQAAGNPAALEASALHDAQPAYLQVNHTVDAVQVVVQVRAASPYAPLAAAALSLRYDPARLAVESCAENPAGRLDLAVCNPTYAVDTVRYTGITTGGIVEWAPLVEVRLRALDAGVLEEIAAGGAALKIVDAALFDLDGNALRPEIGSQPVNGPTKLFLPLILQGAGLAAAELPVDAPPEAAAPEAAPTITEPSPAEEPAEATPAIAEPLPTKEPAEEADATPMPADLPTPEAAPVPAVTPGPPDDPGPAAR